ncbi:MAG: hypothetical protein R3E88_05430 [Myxococcota bacterium]
MEKLVYVLRRRAGDSIEAHRDALLATAAPAILEAGALALTAQVADLATDPRVRPEQLFGEGATYASVVSVWLDSLDARAPVTAALEALGGRVDAYLVTESVPQACVDRTWKDGERSPGVTQIVTFPKPERLTDEAFFRGWHDEHTPFSFELHPTRWSYVRNAVARALTPGAPPYRAIVEERWREFDEWLDPKRLFGSGDVLRRSAEELVHYADFASLNQTLASEWIVKSLRA